MSRRVYPHLAKAPLVEALVDFRIAGASDKASDRLRDLRSEISDAYPKSEQVNRFQAHFQIAAMGDANEIAQEQRPIGYRLTSDDGRHVAMLTVDGFTVSRLRPYDRWESLRDEAMALWERYRGAVEPARITRVALRYINRLDLPADLRDFGDYLTAPPEVPPRLPQTLQGFSTSIVIPIPRLGASATITQQLGGTLKPVERPPGASGVFVLLDIDVFKAVDFPSTGSDAWELADALRDEKNSIFFESITEQMEELCS